MSEGLKRCSKCGRPKPFDAYSSNGRNRKGERVWRSACRDCETTRIAVHRQRRLDNSFPLMCTTCKVKVATVVPYGKRFRMAAVCEDCDPKAKKE